MYINILIFPITIKIQYSLFFHDNIIFLNFNGKTFEIITNYPRK